MKVILSILLGYLVCSAICVSLSPGSDPECSIDIADYQIDFYTNDKTSSTGIRLSLAITNANGTGNALIYFFPETSTGLKEGSWCIKSEPVMYLPLAHFDNVLKIIQIPNKIMYLTVLKTGVGYIGAYFK